MNYAYDTDGRIVAYATGPLICNGVTLPTVTHDAGLDPQTIYVSNGAIVPRPPNPATLSGTTLANLPTPCRIEVNGTGYDCTDTTANLLLDPGVYTVRVVAWPMQDAVFTVRV